MKCENYQEMISLYLDDALSLDEKQHLEEHLKHCHSCTETLEVLSMITRELAQIEEVELPSNFHDELRNKLREDKKGNKPLSKWLSYVAGLAAAFVIGFFMVENTNLIDSAEHVEPRGYQLAQENMSAEVPVAEPVSAEFVAKTRTISEEIWTVECTNIKDAETFLENYTQEHDLSMTKWQVDRLYHYVLDPIEDKDGLKVAIEKVGLVLLDRPIMEDDIQTVHLVISIEE